ncbi:alkyl/aryl-sulfatase BDS1, putative [Entamoeba invadens IP1]|uniref:Alkyl/aryl-sulfatase BDS1, putative n=1 Tax=Entamoeba invadens IP1 TaxID=370355 RepID=A0A0A1U1U2_ENTIV|nr:alkyl/aryl-sulfatase BDS1, putative [Entamoeba invadens IP1]ELP87986.1 alkyl/aryl-sulfatase BDS1, putative [Entamoeba invadens IP1]|eukprot:XP_004254757.1 alkyl/aryl-sulfatase BDS1, putative [Entamoeba invadens IP1]
MACELVKERNKKVLSELDFENTQDFTDSTRGFICTLESGKITKESGEVVFDCHKTDFLDKEKCPDTINPSLWRQCQLTRIHGLFEIIPYKVYQFRGFDLANMSFIKGHKGWIVIDTMCCIETAAAGIKLLRDRVENLPVSAVILTHSHFDHIGGLESVMDKDTVVYTPKDLFKLSVSENLLAGIAMERRSIFMFGHNLERGEKGWIGCGLGTAISTGTMSEFCPSQLIEIGEDKTLLVDGVQIDFIYTPNAEAPTEMMMVFPQLNAVCAAEEVNRVQHNLYTPRGAQARNGKDWAKYIDNILLKYSDILEYSFGSHHWPTFGRENILKYYEKQRDLYKYIHDQTLRQLNLGTTLTELPEKVTLPKALSCEFYNRNYYGTVSHNCRAECQYYLGFYDANPANLNPLTPTKLGEKYVEAIGGEEKCISIAKESFESGDFQWAITLLNHVVFKNPQNTSARKLLAEVYKQTAYMQESAVWRNIYLNGAFELEHTKEEIQYKKDSYASEHLLVKLPFCHLFDFFAVSLDPNQVDGIASVFNFYFSNSEEGSVILKNSVLNNRATLNITPTTSIYCTKSDLILLVLRKMTNMEFEAKIQHNGSLNDFFVFINAINIPKSTFPIVEP